MKMPKVLQSALKKLDVAICGPIWNPIITAATNQILILNEYTETRNFFNDLMPLLILRRHQVFNQVGNTTLSKHYLKQLTKVFSIDRIFQSRECMNQIFEILPSLEPDIALKTFQQMIRYGCNPEVLNVTITYYLIAY